MEKYVITIARGYGSGGHTIGKMLAEELGINFYDREILRLASDDSGINEELFARADEKLKGSLLYKVAKNVYKGELIPPESDKFVSNQNLFNYQAKVLKELAEKESFIVIGRCADYVLKDIPNLIRIFVHAPLDHCIDVVSIFFSCKQVQGHKYGTTKSKSIPNQCCPGKCIVASGNNCSANKGNDNSNNGLLICFFFQKQSRYNKYYDRMG